MLRRTGAHDLRETRDANAHQLPLPALLGLLLAEIVVADHRHRLLQRPGVVPTVVGPSERRVERERLGRDEVLEPELGRVHLQMVGHVLDHPLDGVGGFRHPERAPVGDPSRRLVRVRRIHLDERRGERVRPGDYVEEPRGELRRVRRGVGVAVVREGLHPKRGELSVLRRAHFGLDVIVPGERVGGEVPGAVLHPLHGLAGRESGHDRDDVARVDRHLPTKAASDVRRDDADLVLRKAAHEREDRPNRMGSLRRHPDRQLTHGVDLRDASAGLD